MSLFTPSTVMPAHGAGIHDLPRLEKVVDGRAEPGHDGFAFVNRLKGGHYALACVAYSEATP